MYCVTSVFLLCVDYVNKVKKHLN